MLPRDMNLKIRSRTVGYNNKFLVSNEKFSLGKNEKINTLAQTAATHRDLLKHAPPITRNEELRTMTHNNEKIALVLALASGFAIWNMF